MGCSGCGTRKINGLPTGCKNNGACMTGGCGSMLDVHDWLSNVYYYDEPVHHPVIEVKFKGTRKEYYNNPFHLQLEIGDAVVIESATTGWDLGYISLTGDLVRLQMKKNRVDEHSEQVRKVLRIANEADMAKYDEGKGLEYETMLRARRLANSLNLVMKISDVEYQGDRSKATFFYTAEGRVDFRELIKVMAREFRIKIEMRQIGLRQEAGRLGGIGSCGRELCCSTWLTDFNSVPTTAARYQNLFLNPLKLSGQCGRLKCCLNYELDVYVEALNEFPDENTRLKTEKGIARVGKLDILKRIMWFVYEGDNMGKHFPLNVEQVKLIMEMNARNVTVTDLEEYQSEDEVETPEVSEFKDVVGEESLDRFDSRNKKNRRNKKRGDRPARRDGNSPANAGARPPKTDAGNAQAGGKDTKAPAQDRRDSPEGGRPQRKSRGNRPEGERGPDNRPERPDNRAGDKPREPRPPREPRLPRQDGSPDRPANNNNEREGGQGKPEAGNRRRNNFKRRSDRPKGPDNAGNNSAPQGPNE